MENITNTDPSKKWGTTKKNKPQESRFKLSITFKSNMRPTLPYYSYDYVKLTKEGKIYRVHNESIGYDKLTTFLRSLPPYKYSKASMFFAEDDKKRTDGTGDHHHWLWTFYPNGTMIGNNIGKPLFPQFENGILLITKTLAPLNLHKFKDTPQGLLLLD